MGFQSEELPPRADQLVGDTEGAEIR
jgi:hypothetical protein